MDVLVDLHCIANPQARVPTSIVNKPRELWEMWVKEVLVENEFLLL